MVNESPPIILVKIPRDTASTQKPYEHPSTVTISNIIYDLLGIIDYLAGDKEGNSGHYIAKIKQSNSKWLKFDDKKVTEIEIPKISSSAYILAFSRQ